MTYTLILLPFLACTAAITLATVRRPAFAMRMRASATAAAGLMLLTAIFDNIMIAADLFSYPEGLISGVRIGRAPIEDFAYPLCAAFGGPALWTLFARREDTT